jgi:thymidine phosphorylase
VQGAGVDLRVKLGDPVRAGDALYRVHAQFDADLEFARRMALQDSGYRIGTPEQVPREYVLPQGDIR